MMEQELISSMQALTQSAASILQGIQSYAVGTTAVTFTVGGQTVTVPSLSQQVASYAAQQASDRLAYAQNFGGLPVSQSVARDASGRVSSVTTVLATGFTHIQSLTRDPISGKVSTVNVQVVDALGVVQVNVTKTIKYAGGRYAGV